MSNAICNTNKEIPQDMLLGNLSFISLSDMKIPVTDLEQIFINNGMPESFIKAISKADAFRRATSSIKGRAVVIDGHPVRIEIDEIRCDSDSIKRIIGVKKIDAAAEDISYESVAEVLFMRDTGTCVTNSTVTGQANHQAVQFLCTEIENKYNDWSVYHNKDTVKNIINRIIAATHPIKLMPTGLCKFSPSSASNLLYALKNCLADMNQYTEGRYENIMEIIPIIDTKEQRQLVEKNFKSEISGELMGLVNELREVLQKKQKISSRSAAAYVEKYRQYENKIKDYESLLNVYAGSLHAQMGELLQLIDDGQDDGSDQTGV